MLQKKIHIFLCHKYFYCSNHATRFGHQGYQSDTTGSLKDLSVVSDW